MQGPVLEWRWCQDWWGGGGLVLILQCSLVSPSVCSPAGSPRGASRSWWWSWRPPPGTRRTKLCPVKFSVWSGPHGSPAGWAWPPRTRWRRWSAWSCSPPLGWPQAGDLQPPLRPGWDIAELEELICWVCIVLWQYTIVLRTNTCHKFIKRILCLKWKEWF